MADDSWPAAGITGRGAWHTADGLVWRRAASINVLPAGFRKAYEIRTPAEARRAMRDSLPLTGGAPATRDGRDIFVLTLRRDPEALEARRRFALRCKRPEADWHPVADTPAARNLWLDFYDVTTDAYGQCRGMRADDAAPAPGDARARDGWWQCPLGIAPVLLCLVRRTTSAPPDYVLRFEGAEVAP